MPTPPTNNPTCRFGLHQRAIGRISKHRRRVGTTECHATPEHAGRTLLRSQEQVVKAQAEQARMVDITDVDPVTGMTNVWLVPAANATVHRSETAALLLEFYPHAPFAAVYSDAADRRRWSLRSKIGRVDVARIAETHGGGGHRNAAGFTSPLPEAR